MSVASVRWRRCLSPEVPVGNVMRTMNTLAIVGLGLMGGSLGLAARARGACASVHAYARRRETRDTALRIGAADRVFDDPAAAVQSADLVVLCVPVLAVGGLTVDMKAGLKDGALVTDVGSTKASLAEQVPPLLQGTGAAFVGSHPIAGSELTGVGAARADLYDNALVVLTPSAGMPQTSPQVCLLERFWSSVGARTTVMSPERHDGILARTSHLPHLVAAMLVDTVCREAEPNPEDFVGSGFRDTTRVAAGAEDLWHDVLKTNRMAVLAELDAFGEGLGRLRQMLEEEDFEAIRRFLAEARARRKQWR